MKNEIGDWYIPCGLNEILSMKLECLKCEKTFDEFEIKSGLIEKGVEKK